MTRIKVFAAAIVVLVSSFASGMGKAEESVPILGCSLNVVEKSCSAGPVSGAWSAMDLGNGLLLMYKGKLTPKYASVDKISMSLVFDVDDGKTIMVNRTSSASEGAEARVSIASEMNHVPYNKILWCTLLGKGEHVLMSEKRSAGIYYVDLNSTLFGRVGRIYAFDPQGSDYFDIRSPSPDFNCGRLELLRAEEISKSGKGVKINHEKVSALLKNYMKTGDVTPLEVRNAGFVSLNEQN
jgi:hypothetical protein